MESIEHKGEVLAIVVRSSDRTEGAQFVTEDNDAMQLGLMCHPKGYEIQPHLHVKAQRYVSDTQEVLFIRKGRLRVDFYDEGHTYLSELTLREGDVIVLLRGGHGFKMLEDTEIIEAKTGPYLGDKDKTRFQSKRPNGMAEPV